ncbi:hypothetical protein KA005_24045 [bacterium]|nr:hypothetical protein [bacterium]
MGPPFSDRNCTVEPLVECLNCVTGWNMDVSEFLKTGERIFNLKRLYNVQ